jgi:flagellar hook-basal body complex protein FliE
MPTIPPIGSGFNVTGPEWNVGGVGPLDPNGTQAPQGGGFGQMLGSAVSNLDKSQQEAAGASQTLIDGTATDPTQVVMQVERAQLAMQLASQVRNKAVEAYQDFFHTQV